MFSRTDYDLCVIGGGAAGLVTAAGGAGLGARVALIEKNQLGGECLYTGCVPSKALLHQANLVHWANQAEQTGLTIEGQPDFKLCHDYVHSVISKIAPNDSPERFVSLGVDVIPGEARFIDRQSVAVNDRIITAKKFVLATGTRPSLPPVQGLDEVAFFTNETIFANQQRLPELIILGAGPVGIELAQAHQRLGCRVTVIEMADTILPNEDPELSLIVQNSLDRDGVKFLLGTRATKVRQLSPGNTGLELAVEHRTGMLQTIKGTHLLVATGRSPNIESLGLEHAGIKTDAGKILLDEYLRTTNKRVYACGDVAGPFNFTHMAEHQAGTVLRNTLFHMFAKPENRHIPWSTFTDPELARIGLSEAQARKQNIDYRVFRFPFAEIDRAIIDGQTAGLVKVIVNKKGRILGAALAGHQAGELIHELALAMKHNINLGKLSGLIHIYPALSQINRRVADTYLKNKLTPTRKNILKYLFGLRGR